VLGGVNVTRHEVLGARVGSTSGEAGAGHQDGVQGDVGEEADVEAEGEGLDLVSGKTDVFAAGAEVSEGGVAGTGELDAEGDEGSVELEDGDELKLEAEGHGGGGGGLTLEDPAAALEEAGGELGQEGEAVAVEVTEEIEDLGAARGGVEAEIGGSGLPKAGVHFDVPLPCCWFVFREFIGWGAEDAMDFEEGKKRRS